MTNSEKPMANPFVILRQEFDDWAVLFDPDTGHGFGLNPTGVYIWKLLDGKHSIDDLFESLRLDAEGVPEEAGEHIVSFVEKLVEQGLGGYKGEQILIDKPGLPHRCSGAHEKVPGGDPEADQFGSVALRYEEPRLELFRQERRAYGNCTNGSHDLAGACMTGNAAGCASGGGVGYACSTRNTAGFPPGCGGGSLRSPYGFGSGCATGGADFIPDCSSGNAPA